MENLQEFVTQYGYIAIFLLLSLGIIGLPIPDEVLMTFVGYLCSQGVLTYIFAVAVAFSGAMFGMLFSYFIGKKVASPCCGGMENGSFLRPNGWPGWRAGIKNMACGRSYSDIMYRVSGI